MGNVCCAKERQNSIYIKSQVGVKELKSVYELDGKNKPIGKGAYGIVLQARSVKNRDQIYAIKQIKKKSHDEKAIQAMYREINIMGKVDHAHIIKYYETYEDANYIFLVMELCQNGSLEDRIKNGPLKEKEAAKYLFQVAKALQHCHSIDLVHRDIKPDNLMFGSQQEVKIIDFGLSLIKKGRKYNKGLVGTPFYVAPEVTKGNFGKESDIWSLGVSFYRLMSSEKEPNCYPFPAKTMPDLISKIQIGKYEPLMNTSKECRDLLQQMICVNTKKRITAQQILQHPWILKHAKSEECDHTSSGHLQMERQIIKRLKAFEGKSELKRTLVQIVIKQLDYNDTKDLRKEFEHFDKDSNGLLSRKELNDMLQNMLRLSSSIDSQSTDEQIDSIIKELDHDKNDQIGYTEFLSATIDTQKYVTDAKINEMFGIFDLDGNEVLDVQEIKQSFTKFGKDLTDQELEQIMETHDVDKDGFISKQEFRQIFIN